MMTTCNLKSKRFCQSLALTIFMVALLAGMGVWQLQRLQWKTALINSLNDPQAVAEAPNLPSNTINPAVPEPVLFFGDYLPEYSIFVRNDKVMTVYMPFQTNDGALIMMRRGTVPAGDLSNQMLDYRATNGQVSVVGVPLPKPSAIPMMHEPKPEGLLWTLLDWKAIEAKFKDKALAPYIVVVLDEPDSAMPLTRTPPELRNDHLQYAIFWFVMSGLAAILFGRFLLCPPRGKQVERNDV